MASRSLCLPPARTDFWMLVALGGENGTFSSPRKYGTNWIMPEFVNNGAEECVGINDADFTRVCCFSAQKCFQTSRNSAAVVIFWDITRKLFPVLALGMNATWRL